MKKTSQRSLLFRQNVNRTEAEWVHFLDGYRKALIEFDMKKFGDDWHTAVAERLSVALCLTMRTQDDANAREAALLRVGAKKSLCVMPALVEVGEWRGVPYFVMERIEEIDFQIPAPDGNSV